MSYQELYSPYTGPLKTEKGKDFIAIRCPFHPDDTASAGISVSTGVFNCYVCGALSPAQFIHRISGTPLEEAYLVVDSFRTDSNLVTYDDSFTKTLPAHNPRFEALQEDSLKRLDPSLPLVQEYLESKHLKYETLERCQVGYLPESHTYWKRNSLTFPYRYSNRTVGIRYRDFSANKGGEPGCHFTLWGLDTLTDELPKTVILVEGETDRLTTLQALDFSIPVLSTPTATFRPEWVRELDGIREVLLIPQADDASQKMVEKAQSLLPNLYTIRLPWRRGQTGKDVNDWLRYNTPEDFRLLVETVQDRLPQRILTTNELRTNAGTQRDWLIRNFLARRQVGVLAGQPKSMKTWLALNIIRTCINPETSLFGIPNLQSLQTPLRTLMIEEEGDVREFYERSDLVLGDTPSFETDCFWGHHMGFSWDSSSWLNRISEEITQQEIDLLIVDPFHRTYSSDEDSASEMGLVWHQIHSLLTKHKHLSILLLHHFGKSSSIQDRWRAFRGSSRTAAEADLGIFTEQRVKPDKSGVRIIIEGRSIQSPTAPDGDDTLKLDFNEGIFSLDV